MEYYPVGLNIKNKKILVVGAGRVAERKIDTLLDFGGKVKAVGRKATAHIRHLAACGRISLIQRHYKESDINGMGLIVAATSDNSMNRRIRADAAKRNIWVNVVDDKSLCDFISTAIIRKDNTIISISSDGRDPRLTKDFKDFLKGKLDEFNAGRHKS